MRYWIRLKNGDLQTRERVPKNRPYVSEESDEVKGDFQHYHHTFELFRADGSSMGGYTMESWCGYDRGPKRHNVVRQLFDELKPPRT